MNFVMRPASRSSAKPLIGIYAESGAGKTLSSLMLARGFIGPNGKICMIETESGRGEAFADVINGGYQVITIDGDFSPHNYGDAISEAECKNVDALIIDSGSHEWEGIGGVLDMADQNKASGKKGMQVWTKPKMEHSKHFMLRLTQTPIKLVIICMRAKYPMEEGVDHNNRKTLVRSKQLSPKQDDNILFEMFIHGWIDHDHKWHGTKYTRDDLREVIIDNQPITYATGERLASWAAGNDPENDMADMMASIQAARTPAELQVASQEMMAKFRTLPSTQANQVRAAGVARKAELENEKHYDDPLDGGMVSIGNDEGGAPPEEPTLCADFDCENEARDGGIHCEEHKR